LKFLFICFVCFIVVAAGQNRFEVQTIVATSNPATSNPQTPYIFFSHTPSSNNWKLLGAGASTNYVSDSNITLLNTLLPETDYTGVYYLWFAQSSYSGPISESSITGYATYIYDPYDELDVQFFSAATSTSADFPQISVDVADGYYLTGGGAQAYVSNYQNFLTESYPVDGHTWSAKSKSHINSYPATLTAYAIGIKSLNSSVTISSYSINSHTSASAQHPSATASPFPGSGFVTGGGAQVNDPNDTLLSGNMLWATIPVLDNNGNAVGWSAASKDQWYVDSATITSYVISITLDY